MRRKLLYIFFTKTAITKINPLHILINWLETSTERIYSIKQTKLQEVLLFQTENILQQIFYEVTNALLFADNIT